MDIKIDYSENAPTLAIQLRNQGVKNFNAFIVNNFEADKRNILNLLKRDYLKPDEAKELLTTLNNRLFEPKK